MPGLYSDDYLNPNPAFLGDGTDQRRRRPTPVPKPSIIDLLGLHEAGQANTQPAMPTLPPVAATTAMGAPALAEGIAPTALPPNSVHVGTQTPDGLSPLGRKLAQYRTLQDADIGNKVSRTDWGYEEQPPPARGPSRLMKALEGALSMAAIAGAAGPTEGTAGRMLGGAAVGGAGGAIKPRLVEKFNRERELDEVRGDITEDQAIQGRQAAIINAQTQPELAGLRIQNTLNEALLREQDRRADNKRSDRMATATEEANRIREEHNRNMEKRPVGGATVDYPVNGKTFKVSPNTAARLEQDKITAAGRPTPGREAELEAELEQENETQNLEARRIAEENASSLRARREKLTHKSVLSPDGTWGWAENPRLVERNATQIADIDRQIRDSEVEARDRQRDANAARVRKDKARAKAGASGSTSTGLSGAKGKLTEQQVRDAAIQANLDPDEAVRRARAKGRL